MWQSSLWTLPPAQQEVQGHPIILMFGKHLTSLGHGVAVLAMDPSSGTTGGTGPPHYTDVWQASYISGSTVDPSSSTTGGIGPPHYTDVWQASYISGSTVDPSSSTTGDTEPPHYIDIWQTINISGSLCGSPDCESVL